MLAMQYRFTLPADYDMAIVRRRIADFGHRLDACPQLIVKAYLYAQRSEGSAENLYAPFYLWNSSAGMNDFLAGEGFRGLSQAFGWPRVNHWLPWLTHFDRPHLAEAAWATCQEQAIIPLQRSPCAASATAGGARRAGLHRGVRPRRVAVSAAGFMA